MLNKSIRFGVLVGGVATAGMASAATMDMTAVLAAIADAITAISTVGAACLGAYVAAKVFKMIRAAM